MRAFIQRCVFALLTGYIFYYFSEASFWARPTQSLSFFEIAATITAYSFAAYVFLAAISAFRVRSLAALFLAGALYGWLVEGVISQTLYLDLALSISFTALSWHALITILIGWHLIPSLLRGRRTGWTIVTLLIAGLIYGAWSLFWWVNTPPPTPLPMFVLYTSLTTLGLALAYWLASKVQVERFAPSRAEVIVLAFLWLAYFAFITIPTQPLALIVLPPLLALVLLALRRNRKIEVQPDLLAVAEHSGDISLARACLVFIIPLTAIAVYALALANHLKLPTGIILYLVTTPLGFILLVIALIQSYWKKAAPLEGAIHQKVDSGALTPESSLTAGEN